MGSLIIAAWTWTIANAALADNPGWALVMAAIGGFVVGAELTARADEHWWRTRRSRVTSVPVRRYRGRLYMKPMPRDQRERA
jgi:hypothetical protein